MRKTEKIQIETVKWVESMGDKMEVGGCYGC